MIEMPMFIFFLLFAYLLGSLSSAIIICKLFGLPDPRTQGSGNAGTTNALRIGGKKIAVIVLIGDLLKGFVPIIIAKFFINHELLAWVGLAAVIGHIYPVFFKFKGGKGVATGAGVLLGLSWPLGLCVIATWIIVALVFRYSSLAAIVATMLVPVFGLYFLPKNLFVLSLLSLLILYKHYDNIARLIAGKESKLGRK